MSEKIEGQPAPDDRPTSAVAENIITVRFDGLPVPGYRPQSAESVAIVTAMKITEEKLLRALDELAAREDVDKRWLAIGRTQIEQGFMAVNRSIFRPARLRLEGDADDHG